MLKKIWCHLSLQMEQVMKPLVYVLLVLLPCSQKHDTRRSQRGIWKESFGFTFIFLLVSASSEEVHEAKHTLADLQSCTPRLWLGLGTFLRMSLWEHCNSVGWTSHPSEQLMGKIPQEGDCTSLAFWGLAAGLEWCICLPELQKTGKRGIKINYGSNRRARWKEGISLCRGAL